MDLILGSLLCSLCMCTYSSFHGACGNQCLKRMHVSGTECLSVWSRVSECQEQHIVGCVN